MPKTPPYPDGFRREAVRLIRRGDRTIPELSRDPVGTVLAEKISTAIDLAETNIRVRDLVDIYTVTGSHAIPRAPMHAALLATAEYRGVELVALSAAIEDLVNLRRGDYRAYRDALGRFGEHLPDDLGEAITAATALQIP